MTDLPWGHASPFVIEVRVANSDIDSYGHVNNAVYMRWLDDCARQHSKAVGIDCDDAQQFGYGMAVRHSDVTFLGAAYAGETLLVGNWIGVSDGRLRISREFEIFRQQDGAKLLKATLTYVCIDIATGKPSRLPAQFKQSYQPI
jgi:Predicted thioesterase